MARLGKEHRVKPTRYSKADTEELSASACGLRRGRRLLFFGALLLGAIALPALSGSDGLSLNRAYGQSTATPSARSKCKSAEYPSPLRLKWRQGKRAGAKTSAYANTYAMSPSVGFVTTPCVMPWTPLKPSARCV